MNIFQFVELEKAYNLMVFECLSENYLSDGEACLFSRPWSLAPTESYSKRDTQNFKHFGYA